MVHNEGFAGAVGRNPYNFERFNVSYMQLYTDGEQVLSKLLKLNVGEDKYLDAFETLYNSFDNLNGEKVQSSNGKTGQEDIPYFRST